MACAFMPRTRLSMSSSKYSRPDLRELVDPAPHGGLVPVDRRGQLGGLASGRRGPAPPAAGRPRARVAAEIQARRARAGILRATRPAARDGLGQLRPAVGDSARVWVRRHATGGEVVQDRLRGDAARRAGCRAGRAGTARCAVRGCGPAACRRSRCRPRPVGPTGCPDGGPGLSAIALGAAGGDLQADDPVDPAQPAARRVTPVTRRSAVSASLRYRRAVVWSEIPASVGRGAGTTPSASIVSAVENLAVDRRRADWFSTRYQA